MCLGRIASLHRAEPSVEEPGTTGLPAAVAGAAELPETAGLKPAGAGYVLYELGVWLPGIRSGIGCGPPQHGLSSNKMALITSDCG